MGIIYKISCDISSKEYVGQSIQSLEKRWRDHLNCAKSMIRYKDDLEKIRYIQFSYLYRAMAYYGIHHFKIEIIEEVDDNMLDEMEIAYIKELNTQAPNGFNLTSGGTKFRHCAETIALMKQRKHEFIDNVRNEKLRGLPVKTAYRNHEAKGEQIVFNNHPLCKHKTFSTKTYGSFENAKIAAIEFIQNLEATNTIYIRSKNGDDDLKNKPGLLSTPKGYRVNKVHKGVNYDKRFERKDRTREENKIAAIDWYNNLLARLNVT